MLRRSNRPKVLVAGGGSAAAAVAVRPRWAGLIALKAAAILTVLLMMLLLTPPPVSAIANVAVFAGGDDCSGHGKYQLDVSGSDQTINGATHTNDNYSLGGNDNVWDGSFTYVNTTANSIGASQTFDPGYSLAIPDRAWPVSYALATYEDMAQSPPPGFSGFFCPAGTYPKATETEILANGDGLHYAEGPTELSTSDESLDITLVSEGTIDISGSNVDFSTYVDDLFAFAGHQYSGVERCDKASIKMSGSGNSWTGVVCGPYGMVESPGSGDTSLVGCIAGWSVRLNGADISVTGSCAALPPTTPTTPTTVPPTTTTTEPPTTTTEAPAATTTTTAPSVVQGSATVGDYVWRDADGDALQDAVETGVEGAKVRLTNIDTDAVAETSTDSDGKYLFVALAEGNCEAEIMMGSVSGAVTTAGSCSFFLCEGESLMTVDFGIVETLPVTGIDADRLAWAGIAALALGSLLVIVGRRERRTEI
jgi:hypothetical protein